MPWNGSGTFNRIYSWVADKAAGLDISSTRMDTDTNDIATGGFGNCLTRDGQGQPTANLPMAGFRHTGVQNGVNRTDYASLGQVQDDTGINWQPAGGTSDALTATYVPALTALVDGQFCCIRATAANTTTTPTFAPNSLTAHTITKIGGAALAIGDIPGALAELILRYNLANTRWELLNPATVKGTIFEAGTAGGSANAITVTDANFNSQDGYLLRFWAANTNSGATTLAVSGGTARAIVKDTSSGPIALTGAEITASNSILVVWDNSNSEWHLLAPILSVGALQLLKSAMGLNMPINLGLVASVATNILTVAIKDSNGSDPSANSPVWIPFQTLSSSEPTGAPTWIELTSALSIDTHATGATFGVPNATAFHLWVVVFNDGGTLKMALINCLNGTQILPLVEGLPASSTAVSGSATSAGVFYTEFGVAAVTSKAFRILGYLSYESGLVTSGTFNNPPTYLVQRGPGDRIPGDVIQSLRATSTTQATTTNASFTQLTSTVSVAISPTSAANPIEAETTGTAGSGNTNAVFFQLARGTTLIGNPYELNVSPGGGYQSPLQMKTVDSPQTTSSTTYSVYGKVVSGTALYPPASTGIEMFVREIMS